MKTRQQSRDELRRLLVGSPFAVHVDGRVLVAMLDDLDKLDKLETRASLARGEAPDHG